MIFSLFSFDLLFWEWENEKEISVISSLFSSFLGEKNGRINWKKSKEIPSLFLLNFLYFFLFSSFSFSVFSSFSGGGMESEEDKKNCTREDKGKMRGHLLFQQNHLIFYKAKTFSVSL